MESSVRLASVIMLLWAIRNFAIQREIRARDRQHTLLSIFLLLSVGVLGVYGVLGLIGNIGAQPVAAGAGYLATSFLLQTPGNIWRNIRKPKLVTVLGVIGMIGVVSMGGTAYAIIKHKTELFGIPTVYIPAILVVHVLYLAYSIFKSRRTSGPITNSPDKAKLLGAQYIEPVSESNALHSEILNTTHKGKQVFQIFQSAFLELAFTILCVALLANS